RNMPVLERSAGISVALRQPPLAYCSKSSPGCTVLSRPARSMPITGAAGAVAAGGVASSAAEGDGVRLQATLAQMAIASRVGPEARLKVVRMTVTIVRRDYHHGPVPWTRHRQEVIAVPD